MTADVTQLPVAPPDEVPAWLPASVRREAAAVARWLEGAQTALARLPGAEPRHHRVLRVIADELLSEILAPFDAAP